MVVGSYSILELITLFGQSAPYHTFTDMLLRAALILIYLQYDSFNQKFHRLRSLFNSLFEMYSTPSFVTRMLVFTKMMLNSVKSVIIMANMFANHL